MKYFILFLFLIPSLIFAQNKSEGIKNEYEYIYGFENGYAVFRTFDKKMGLIDSIQTEIIVPKFEYIHNRKELKNLYEAGIIIEKKFKRGFINKKGEAKIPFIYDDVYYLDNGLIRVGNSEKFGVIDTLNNIVLSINFDFISLEINMLLAEKNKFYQLFNQKGKRFLASKFINFFETRFNKAIVKFNDNTSCVIDNKGVVKLHSIKNYTFETILNEDLYLISNNKTLKKGVVDSLGQFKINCKYDKIQQTNSLFIVENNNKKGFVSLKDSILKPLIYNEIYFSYFYDAIKIGDDNLEENYIAVKNKLKGVVNPYLEKDVIPFDYSYISTLSELYFIVEKTNNKKGIYCKNGVKILSEEYEFYNHFKDKIFAKKLNKPYLITLDNSSFTEIQLEVDELIEFKNTDFNYENFFQIFKIKDKYGVIDNELKVVIPCQYDKIENIYSSKEFIVKSNNKFGVVDVNNQHIVPIEYDEYVDMKEVLLFKKDNNKTKKYHEKKFR